jgi:hypothetical protein
MRRLMLEGPGALAWRDGPEPDLEDGGQALVRPLAVATCDLDGPMVAGARPFPRRSRSATRASRRSWPWATPSAPSGPATSWWSPSRSPAARASAAGAA